MQPIAPKFGESTNLIFVKRKKRDQGIKGGESSIERKRKKEREREREYGSEEREKKRSERKTRGRGEQKNKTTECPFFFKKRELQSYSDDHPSDK